MNADISPEIKKLAPVILAEIQKAKSILLHCHPSPDPDSVGSALAMKFALEGMGKQVTVIQGDSDIPDAFMHFPGARTIAKKNFTQIDLAAFDLFISQDTSTLQRITTLEMPKIPETLRLVNIDHHATNTNFGHVNLVVPSYPAVAQMLFDLFAEWNVAITPDIAANLFIGMYTDTGGFRFGSTTARTYEIASKLVRIIPSFSELISKMELTNTSDLIVYEGLALNSVETFLGGKLAIAAVSRKQLDEKGIGALHAHPSIVSNILRSVIGWEIDVSMVETDAGTVKLSTRTRDPKVFDVSKLAVALGGGGHVAAAGAVLYDTTIDEAKKLVVAKAKELYNL